MLVVEVGDVDVFYMFCIWKGDEIIGEIIFGVWGYCVNVFIVLGMIKFEYVESGIEFEVEIYG